MILTQIFNAMRKRVLPTLAGILLACSVLAGIVPLEQAEKAALSFYYQKHNQFEGMISIGELSIISTYTEIESGIPYYHVFHFKQGGYVVISATDLLHPVIAYSFDNVFDVKLEGPANFGLMNHYKDMISFVCEQGKPQRASVAESWKIYLSDQLPPIEGNKDWGSVGPMLTTLWNQGWPYNYYCPETPTGGSGGHVWAGCVATAVQQIMAYYRWPDHGQGSNTYIPEDYPEYGPQSADFENSWYRWDEMSDEPQTVNLAIAELLYHIGVGYHMNYAPGGSPIGTDIGEDSICFYFKYLDYYPEHAYFRDSISYEEWITILKDNIDRKLPVFYSGYETPGGVGHAFVCDGYQDSAYFHLNLGWGGLNNGYYTIDNIPGNFTYNQYMVVERYPDTMNFTYPLYPSGTDTLNYVEGSIEDGSGPISDYLNNHQSSWLISPQDEVDSVTNMDIEIKRLDLYNDGDRLYIYDGNDNTALLLAEFSGFLETDSTLTTSGNQAFVEFITDGSNTANGFHLSYYCNMPVWCGMTQITEVSGTFDDGSGDFYYNNSKQCIWEIDPGIVCPSLELSFNYFMTEASADILYVYDLENNELLAEISGEYSTSPPPVVSTSGKMKLRFNTNKSIRNDGWEVTYHMVDIEENNRPLYSQIRPNPASDRINIAFTLYDKRNVRIELIDIAGNKVSIFHEGDLPPATYDLSYNIDFLDAGMYFCKIRAGNQVETKKLIIIR